MKINCHKNSSHIGLVGIITFEGNWNIDLFTLEELAYEIIDEKQYAEENYNV